MDRRAWQATVHKVAKSWTQLKQINMHTTLHFSFGLQSFKLRYQVYFK